MKTVPIPGSAPSIPERSHWIRSQLPQQGLFAGHDWRIAPAPFEIDPRLAAEFESLGRVFLQFYRALNLLYRKSVEGKLPGWIARWLDLGKASPLLDLQRSAAFKTEIPRVIRPDVLLTDDGIRVSELDSVPGGIGLTAWLNKTYSAPEAATAPVIGGERGMLDGFAGIFGEAPRVHIVVSDEASTYRPEMIWLAEQLGDRFQVQDAAFSSPADGDAIYRFFELFDLPNIPGARSLLEKAEAKRVTLTPPPKPIFEEKMIFALLWNRNLQEFWRQELGEGFLKRLLAVIPYTWMIDPAPLPPHGAIPGLDLTDWQQLKTLSQKQRELVLKVSGYSEEAWGARGVFLGSDLPHAEWSKAVDRALNGFEKSPCVLQRYHRPSLVDTAWFDFEQNQSVPMKGRARLCPYYFVHGTGDNARANLAGILATVCPADKKIIHGMTEAVFAPCSIRLPQPTVSSEST